MTKRFLLFVFAFLLLGAGGFWIVLTTTHPSNSPFSSLPSDQVDQTENNPASLSLSLSDDPVLLEAELKDTQLDTIENDLSDLEQEIDSN